MHRTGSLKTSEASSRETKTTNRSKIPPLPQTKGNMMRTQSFIALVTALSLLASAPLAQARNTLKKPIIERIDGALAKAQRTRESRALIRKQRRQQEAAKQKTRQERASAPAAPQH